MGDWRSTRKTGFTYPLSDVIFEEVAEVYRETYGEPLYADAEWVAPIYEQCEIAVSAEAGSDAVEFEAHVETVKRTAAVIAVMTLGLDALKAEQAREFLGEVE